MKMVKKILLGLAATACAVSFMSCGIKNKNAKVTGLKTNKTMEIDATDVAEGNFLRAFNQLGTLEQVSAIKSTLTFNKDEVSNDSVVGYAFDLNNDKDDKGKDIQDSYNFVLIGFRPSDGKFYLERYKGVSMKANNGEVSNSALGNYISCSDGSSWSSSYGSHNDWRSSIKGNHYTIDEDNNITLKITVTQETKKTYKIMMGTEEIGSYTREDDVKEVNLTTDGKAQGGIAFYANAKPGAKFTLNCKTNAEDVEGKWVSEEIEE